MYHKLQDFLNDWEYESKATLKIFNAMNNESLEQKVYDDGRTLGYLAWHITISVGEMMNRTGLSVKMPDENSNYPPDAAKIVSTYEDVCNSLVGEINTKWKDDTLQVEDEMYGEKWKRGSTLGILITHQVHHRAQMTVLLRQAGLKVPGIYGPSKEEWSQIGMEAPK